MRTSTLLKSLLLAAAFPLRMADDSGTAAPADAGNVQTIAPTATPGATPAAAAATGASANATQSSASPASQDAGTEADTPSGGSTPADLQSQLDAANARIVDLESQLAAAKRGSDHPIHPILGAIEAEVSRPGVILVAEVRTLLNRARALFR